MSEKAFPTDRYNMKGGYDIDGGMSLRDYFAAKVMQSYVSSWPDDQQVKAKLVAQMSYQIADAMLAERENSK